MIDVQQIAQRYIASWNEDDAATRRVLVDALWVKDARYVDPMMQADGQDQIMALIAGVKTQFPGCRFKLAGQPDGYSAYARFSWSLSAANGSEIAHGTDFATVSSDGRLANVTGFLDQVPDVL